MFRDYLEKMRESMFPQLPPAYKEEFDLELNNFNLPKGKIVATAIIAVEIVIIVISLFVRKEAFGQVPSIYYGAMYFVMIAVMLFYLFLFNWLEKDKVKYQKAIKLAGISFAAFILLWCAFISLMDQQFSGGGLAVIYMMAVIAIAIIPLYEPLTLLSLYLPVHMLFLLLLPFFEGSGEMLFSNYINSTSFVVMAWVISFMRYKSQIEYFVSKNEVHKKNIELGRINRELARANERLELMSQTDNLTGISNRLIFDTTLTKEWSRCKRQFLPLSLVMIDIDYFKEFNDHYGHQAGDECIKKVAHLMALSAKRSSDMACRYGGDEFALILPQTDEIGAVGVAEQLRNRVEKLEIPHQFSPVSDYVTISLSVCTVVPSDKLTLHQFIENADKALYEAKKRNRNNTVVA